MGDPRHRQINPLAGQELQRTQFVTRARNRHRLIERIATQHFKLAQRGGTVKGNRRTNSRDHCIKMGKLTAFVMDRRRRGVNVHITRQRIENFDQMPARNGSFA